MSLNVSLSVLTGGVVLSLSSIAFANPVEIYCTIREPGSGLSCQWTGSKDSDRRVMNPDEIPNFVDAGQSLAYLTVKSRKGLERTFMIDPAAPQYKKLNEVKKSSSISQISKAKSDFFADIEKRAIKISDDLDALSGTAELVKYDPSIANDKFKRENFDLTRELAGFRKNQEKLCTTTPAFEQMSRANASLQQTLSSLVTAFQAPDSCMTNFKVFKDKDGAVDLRQLATAATQFKEMCKKK